MARIDSEYKFIPKSKEWNFAFDSDEVIILSGYYFHGSRLLKYFSKDDLLILDFDKMLKKPESVLSKVYDFVKAGQKKLS